MTVDRTQQFEFPEFLEDEEDFEELYVLMRSEIDKYKKKLLDFIMMEEFEAFDKTLMDFESILLIINEQALKQKDYLSAYVRPIYRLQQCNSLDEMDLLLQEYQNRGAGSPYIPKEEFNEKRAAFLEEWGKISSLSERDTFIENTKDLMQDHLNILLDILNRAQQYIVSVLNSRSERDS